MSKRKIIIAVTGASGSIYAKLLLDTFLALRLAQDDNYYEIGILLSDNAKVVWKHEIGNQEYKIGRASCRERV